MLQTTIKILITSILVIAVSEAAKRSAILGAILASLPLTSVLAMIWLYAETQDPEKVASLADGIFWLVLPSLTLFLVLPILLRKGMGFTPSLLAAIALTTLSYILMLQILKWFGIAN